MFMVLRSGFVLVDTVCVICCYETAVLRTDLTPELSWNERSQMTFTFWEMTEPDVARLNRL